MASGFWYLEDGRCFARNVAWMTHLLKMIIREMKELPAAELFCQYLEQFVPDSESEFNGYGGFIRKKTGENIMMVFDLREFTPENQNYFWRASQQALKKLVIQADSPAAEDVFLLKKLLDMHKRIIQGEAPEKLSDTGSYIEPYSGKKVGPGWI